MSGLATSSGLFLLLAIVLYWGAVARLKRIDPREFTALGSPEGLHSDAQASSWLMGDYMLRCRFMFQGDIVLAILGTLWYLSMLLALVLFIWEVVST
jgi:hypothetical protein